MQQGEHVPGMNARRVMRMVGELRARRVARTTRVTRVPVLSPAPRIPVAAIVPVLTPRGRITRVHLRCQVGWRQLRAAVRKLPTYPLLPAAPDVKSRRWADAVLTLIVGCYIVFFTAYLFAAHDAYKTNAEDMGIMTQALWTTTHGALLHQTICNIISDTNCLGDVSRLGVHVEPIMLPLALIYALAPSPKTLQLVQVLVVAAGAFPAAALATRRLQRPSAGIAFALLYLFHPSLDAALTYDFHAVTLSAAFLMFALYFLLDGNARGLLIASVLAMSTKEEVPLTILMIGLWVLLFQRRWRLGAGLVALALAWLVIAVALMHAMSPMGESPVTGRYGAYGTTPPEIALGVLTHLPLVARTVALDAARRAYLAVLLAPLAFLPLLCPWMLLISGPDLLVNMLSDKALMYSGGFQYNAEIVPTLIAASVEAIAVTVALAGWARGRWSARPGSGFGRDGLLRARFIAPMRRITRDAPLRRLASQLSRALRGADPPRLLARPSLATCTLALLLVSPVLAGLQAQRQDAYLPIGREFSWPRTTPHTHAGDQLIAAIPPSASVSAQTDLVAHLSNRHSIYLYPYAAHDAAYVLLDTTTYQYSADLTPSLYCGDLRAMLADPEYTLLAASDGYVEFGRVSAGRVDVRAIGGPSGQPQGPGSGGPGDSPPSLPFSVPGCDAPSP